jgi:hypothetical protein
MTAVAVNAVQFVGLVLHKFLPLRGSFSFLFPGLHVVHRYSGIRMMVQGKEMENEKELIAARTFTLWHISHSLFLLYLLLEWLCHRSES